MMSLADAGPGVCKGQPCPPHWSTQTCVAEGLLCAKLARPLGEVPGPTEPGARGHIAQDCSDQRATVMKDREGPSVDTKVLREVRRRVA